jgi:serine/alanine adding enzyme
MGPPRVTDHIDEGVWRAFVEREPSGNVFHTPEMHRVFGMTRRHRPAVWAATDPAGEPRAMLLPVQITLAGGPLRSWTSRAVAYGGLLCTGDPDGRGAARELVAAYRRSARGLLFTELRHQSDATALRDVLEPEGFEHEAHLNYLIDLDRCEEDLWGSMGKTAQQRIRSATRKGVIVEEVTHPGALEDSYRVLASVYARVGVPLADPSLFRSALSILGPRDMFHVFTARLGEDIIGARYLLTYKDRIIDWYAGADRAFASRSPNELLVWHTLTWGRARGYRAFDFGGAGRPNEPYGPREFKSKFGGALVDLGRDILVHSPGRLRLSRAGYEVARRILRRRSAPGLTERNEKPRQTVREGSGDDGAPTRPDEAAP